MLRYILIALFTVFACITNVQADDNADHIELLSKHYNLQKPVGEGPFPAVMLVPGVTGFGYKHYDNVEKKLLGLGFVTLRVNYIEGIKKKISARFLADSAGGDICTAAEYLKLQPFVKKGAINVIGWSLGGAGVFIALSRTESREPVQVDAAVAYYPYCIAARPWDSDIPVLVLMGEIDNVAPIDSCENVFDRLPNRDGLAVRIYDNAHHCFDYPNYTTETDTRLGKMLYNKAVTEAAWVEVTKFLKR